MALGKGKDFRDAMAQGEVAMFLRGDGAYRKTPQSDFAGEDAPTDTWKALQEIYAANETLDAGSALSEGISTLLRGTVGDVYLAILYLTRLSLAEQGGRLPFRIPLRALLATARERVETHRKAFARPLDFPNGFVKKRALEDLKGWNEAVFLPYYGIDLLPSDG